MRVLSPLGKEEYRSAETLVAAAEPAKLVNQLAERKIFVTEKPQGIRVAPDFFNNEDDIEALIEALHSLERSTDYSDFTDSSESSV